MYILRFREKGRIMLLGGFNAKVGRHRTADTVIIIMRYQASINHTSSCSCMCIYVSIFLIVNKFFNFFYV